MVGGRRQMAENENHIQETKEQSNASEKEEDHSDQPTEVHDVPEEGPPEEPADGMADTVTANYTVESPSEDPEIVGHDVEEGPADEVTTDESVGEKDVTTQEAESADHADITKPEHPEIVGHDVVEGPTDEVTTDETVREKDVTTQEAESADHADITKPEDPGIVGHDVEEAPTGEVTTDETVREKDVRTQEAESADHADITKPEDSEIVGHDVGEVSTDEVTTDETVGEKDVTTQEAESADHADIIKPGIPTDEHSTKKTEEVKADAMQKVAPPNLAGVTLSEGLIIIECSKIGVGEGTISLECAEKSEDKTVEEGAICLDDTTESPIPVVSDQSNEKPEEEPVIEPSITCEELREKLEAQISAIEAAHGKFEPAKTESPVSRTRDPECLIYQTPPTAADRDIKKRSVLQSYPAPPKTPSPDIARFCTATVKVALLPTGDVMTMALPICLTAGKLKARFGKELKVPAHMLQITCDSRMAKDSETLVDLGVRPHGSIQLELASTDTERYPIKRIRPQQDYATSDVITVTVQKDDKTCCSVVVEIERLPYHKPFLGGYKHKLTGTEFHHAGTQTPSKRRTNCHCVEKFCRETQTVSEKNQYQQTANNTSTQMTKIGCYVSNITDKLITPGRYFTAAEYHAWRLKAVIVLQTYFRRWSAKNYVQQLRMQRNRRMQWEQEQELKVKMEKQNYIKKQYERRMNPKTKEDFDLLFHALEVWKQEELSNINRTLTGPERKAALYTLLEQEAQLIASITRHKADAAKETGPKLIQNLLNKCADPIRWKAYDGRVTEMDTPFTIRARELRDIYNSINMKYLTQDERLDALLTLKHTVKEHDCKLTQEIVELIDREADLLMRQVKEFYLEGLRQRISTLFLQYLRTPTFNPEVARFLKVPQDPMQLRKNIYFCSSCGSYLPSTEFPLSLTSRTLRICQQCFKLNNEARRREESTLYKLMLKRLRKAEAHFEDGAQIAFLLQEKDLKHLVDSIWGTQSALSASKNMKDLTMIRWDKRFEWSPWNCILLTEEEAVAHFKVSNIEKDYEATFIRKIKHRHTLGKTYFSRIPEIVNYAHTCLMQDLTSMNDLVITNSFQDK
ncbi:IQ motif and ubiquitin-like domain-containing protein isoform X2 [Heterodontus francisci]|uniref:IQ motif and ubiquitin-like domain-containing protein isoform X2 n=1 Tax=Heterodontus francisci TaxID=7792 RepID=UPI00355B7988